MAKYIGLDGANLSGGDVYNTTFELPLNYAMIADDFSPSDGSVATLINTVRYKGACCGSANITSESKISNNWYCFIWIPHRSGGQSGGDNMNYGVLLLYPMTFTGSYGYVIRYQNGSLIYQRFALSKI